MRDDRYVLRRSVRDVDTEISARDAAFGADPTVTRGVVVAGGLFALTALPALLGEFATLPGGLRPLYGLVLLGAVLAAAAAYRNSGLIVSWLLALAPAAGALAVQRVWCSSTVPSQFRDHSVAPEQPGSGSR